MDCDTKVEGAYSATLTIINSIWGDVAGPGTGEPDDPPFGPPDGMVTMTLDVTAALDKFRNLDTAPIQARVDQEPDLPDQLGNISDVMFIYDVFNLQALYPFPGPVQCQ